MERGTEDFENENIVDNEEESQVNLGIDTGSTVEETVAQPTTVQRTVSTMDTTSTGGAKASVKIPTFDGKESGYMQWRQKFTVVMNALRCAVAINDKVDVPNTEDEADELVEKERDKLTDAEKKQVRAINANTMLILHLTTALTTDAGIVHLSKAQDDDWPRIGLAHRVMASLDERFDPKDTLTEAEKAMALQNVNMKKYQHPDDLEKQLTKLSNQYHGRNGHIKVTNGELIAAVLRVIPQAYKAVISTEQLTKGNKITWEDLIKAMKLHYRTLYGHKTDSGSGNEMTLGFLGKCYECGEAGHRANKCPIRKDGPKDGPKAKKFSGKCHICKKKGHKKSDCFYLEKNKDKRPANWKDERDEGKKSSSDSEENGGGNGGEISAVGIDFVVAMIDRNPNMAMAPVDIPGAFMSKECSMTPFPAEDILYLRKDVYPACHVCEDSDSNEDSVPPPPLIQRPRPRWGDDDSYWNDSDDEYSLGYEDSEDDETSVTYVDEDEYLDDDAIEITFDYGHDAEPELPDVMTPEVVESPEYGLAMAFPNHQRLLEDPDIWIADSGATQHTTPHPEGLVKLKTPVGSLTGQTGKALVATRIGNLPVMHCDRYGNEVQRTTLTNVAQVKSANFNLFSISRMLKCGWSGTLSPNNITITKGDAKIVFDIQVDTPNGRLFCVCLKRTAVPELMNGNVDDKTKRQVKLPLQKVHSMLGHANEDATRLMANHLGIQLTRGNMKPCLPCTIGKAQQRAVSRSKEKHPNAVKDNERRVFLDLMSLVNKANKRRFHLRLMIDQASGLKSLIKCDTKNEMVEPTCEELQKWKDNGRTVKYIRLDNAGENKLLKQRTQHKDWKLNITYEFTAAQTPQQNSVVEVGFATLTKKVRAIMSQANVTPARKWEHSGDCFSYVTKLDNLLVSTINGKTGTRYEHFGATIPTFTQHLRVWGEAGTVKTHTKRDGKLADRGTACMFVDYAVDHAGDVYVMYDPKTKSRHFTRDVIWLHRMYYPSSGKETTKAGESEDPTNNNMAEFDADVVDVNPNENQGDVAEPDDEEDNEFPTNEDELISDEEDEEPVDEQAENTNRRVGFWDEPWHLGGSHDSDDSDDDEDPTLTGVSRGVGRVSRLPARFRTANETGLSCIDLSMPFGIDAKGEEYFDAYEEPTELAALSDYQDATSYNGDFVLVGTIGGGFGNTSELRPIKFKEAMQGKDKEEWKKAAMEEHRKFQQYQVVAPESRKSIPKDVKILTSTWAMKKKANGVFRARLNARGFEQVDGKHYQSHDISAPVTNDMTIRIIFVLMILAGWTSHLVDVKGAFLHGLFADNEVLYMEIPEGWEHLYPAGCVLRLLKTVYGLKQAAKMFWREMLKCFKSMGYNRSAADPCLYYRRVGGRLCLWLSWIDDCFVCGHKSVVMTEKHELMKRFDCDDTGEAKEYVGCKINRDWKNRSVKFTQPILLQSYKDEFDLPKSKQAPRVPAEPNDVLLPPVGDEVTLELSEQKTYRKGIGKLLHMMRWSRPEMMNRVREMSRGMMTACPRHLKAMYRTMNYVVATPNRGWMLKPTGPDWDDRDENYVFRISGKGDAEYAKDTTNRRSVSGYSTFLNDAPISCRSVQQETVALSTTEAELNCQAQTAQDMLYAYKVLKSLELKVEEPMILECDNKGTVDLINNWSVSGRTRHVDVKKFWLRDLKEDKIVLVTWIKGDEMSSDLFTKNLAPKLFEKHAKVYVGNDEYMVETDG